MRTAVGGRSARLDLFLKGGVYTLIALGFLPLMIGQAFHVGVALVFGAIVVASWFVERREALPGEGRLFTGMTVVMIVAALAGALFSPIPVVEIGVLFVLYLTGAKLFQRQRLADYLQLLALSFLLLAAASAFNNDLTFGLFFAGYVLVGVVTFAVYHLQQQLEENEQRGGQRTGELFSWGYAGILSVMAVLIFVASVSFFFIFPRLGFGFFVKKQRDGLQTTGFSENVDLGTHGTIKSDNSVVMQVTFPDGMPPEDLRYWRGISFDKYDGTSWSSTLTNKRRISPMSGWSFDVDERADELSDRTVRQQIYLEPIGSSILFGMPTLMRVGYSDKDKALSWLRRRRLEIGENGDVRRDQHSEIGFAYQVDSYIEPPDPDTLRGIDRKDTWRVLGGRHASAYLQLPHQMSPKIRALAEQITEGATNDYDRAERIERWLRTNLTYTTDLPDPGTSSPLEAFLFETKRGHCEYFATAMVILARTVGVPARSVNGFRGGQWNDIGEFLAVRNADAHSWVEIYFAEVGWVTFDPTPAASDVSNQRSTLTTFYELYDSMRFLWLKYVIEYDLETQIEFLRQASQTMGADPDNTRAGHFSWGLRDMLLSLRHNALPALLLVLLSLIAGGFVRIRAGPRWRDALIAAAAGAVGWFIVWSLWKPSSYLAAELTGTLFPVVAVAWGALMGRRRGDKPVRHDRLAELYLDLRDGLVQRGLELSPAVGPEGVLERVRSSNLPHRQEAIVFLRRYLGVRFGGEPLDASELKELDRSVRRTLKALRKPA